MLYDAFLYISWWFHRSILKTKLRISFPIVLILSGDIIVPLTLTGESLSVSQMQPSLSRNTLFSGSLHAFLHCLPLPEEVSLFPSCYSTSSSPSVSPKSPVGPWSFSSTCVFLEHSQTDVLLGISLSTLCFDTLSSHMEAPPPLASTASSSSASFLALQTLSLEKEKKAFLLPRIFYAQCLCLCNSFSQK